MNYLLTAYADTYLAQDVQLPSESSLSHDPKGKPYSFVSPIRLPIGKTFTLSSDHCSFELIVNGCFGFTYTGNFFISGVIVDRQESASRALAA